MKEAVSSAKKVFHRSNTITKVLFIVITVCIVLIIGGTVYYYIDMFRQAATAENLKSQTLQKNLTQTQKQLTALKQEDQYKKNITLQEHIKNIEDTYLKSQTLYEKIQDLKAQSIKTVEEDTLFAKVLKQLSERNFTSASATLSQLEKTIASTTLKNSTPATQLAINAVASNTPPASGFSQQKVTSDVGEFVVSIVSADLGSTRVIVDTASDSDCSNNCPVLSLGDYVARSGAFAGINGAYFCPAEYPSCAGKTNTYDTLLMNKNKVYFNSENNKYSTVPAAIFGSGFVRVVGASQEWGRDTGIDSMIANQPLLLSGGNITFGGDGDPKKGSRGSRSFVGSKGSTVYIGVVYNATVAEVAHVLKTMELENALNLDSGGSTALWSGGYKAGPGRNIPNAILFVRK